MALAISLPLLFPPCGNAHPHGCPFKALYSNPPKQVYDYYNNHHHPDDPDPAAISPPRISVIAAATTEQQQQDKNQQ
jgi:hypothetical protein